MEGLDFKQMLVIWLILIPCALGLMGYIYFMELIDQLKRYLIK
jgi:hypothetical protein